MGQLFFSKKGMAKFLDDVRRIEQQIADCQSNIGEHSMTGGDAWHDNFSYENTRRELTLLNGRLKGFYEIRANSLVIDYPKTVNHIQLGCKVTFKLDGNEITYDIVGFGESDPENGKIAYNTPLSKSLILKKPGDCFRANIGRIERTLEILATEPIDG